ncbi:T9SS C-terminal target domain-containing protein [Dawidia soli]|uniref:T9SS C-terminal target domain-containing protein n=1 Tax=Dawidia soli TaxID=2782352 RepID=A0AAP2GLW9_9BACT|nr:T9SS C-terminal target domain-containing protein [Dawidia soli]MBT1690623.1 T9SS C-terminal target domain-containing protein [Dawidia soli]
MNQIFKSAAIVAVLAAALTSCDDQGVSPRQDAAGKAAAIIDLGLPGGTDAVDAFGNVTVSRNLTLKSGDTYILHNYFRIQDGFTITIEPGVTIQGVKKGTSANDVAPGTLVIERGAKINAIGDKTGAVDSAIVFTSNSTPKVSGDWGGVVILGKAPVSVTGGVTTIEGLPTPNNTGFYGGTVANDNSGVLKFVRIEYAGDVIGTDNELNGLTLGGVGSGTTIDHVQVSYGFDDGFEFFGGTVNAKHLISYYNTDDDFDTDLGYSGKVQFGIVVRNPNIAVTGGGSNGFESNGDNAIGVTPYTNAVFANFTILGPIQPTSTSIDSRFRSGVLIRAASELNLFNSIVTGYKTNQLELATPTAFDADANNATDNLVSIEGVTIVAPTFAGLAGVGTNVSNFTTVSSYDNRSLNASVGGTGTIGTLPAQTGLSAAAWSTTSRSFVASTEQPAVTGNNLLSGLTSVNFRGAFGDVNDSNNASWFISAPWVAFN